MHEKNKKHWLYTAVVPNLILFPMIFCEVFFNLHCFKRQIKGWNFCWKTRSMQSGFEFSDEISHKAVLEGILIHCIIQITSEVTTSLRICLCSKIMISHFFAPKLCITFDYNSLNIWWCKVKLEKLYILSRAETKTKSI